MAEEKQNPLRKLPSVERLLQSFEQTALPRALIKQVIQHTLNQLRKEGTVPNVPTIEETIQSQLQTLTSSKIRSVINATGIVVHTNLGRAPIAESALAASVDVAGNYSTLEFDSVSGKRGSRGSYIEKTLALLTGAEAAAVVNNCAAALVLILKGLTQYKRKEVILSRGELIQIGGGFRIHDMLVASGATLVEVGSTNKTTIDDYRHAITEQTALILSVHRSNFVMEGFVGSPTRKELVALAQEHALPLVEDLGSGALIDTSQWHGLSRETLPMDALAAGVDLVCFSGDKLMGGPQSGLIVGKQAAIASLKKHPMYRALRCDKLILTALQSVIDAYLNSDSKKSAAPDIPIYTMLDTPIAVLKDRAEQIVNALNTDSSQFTLSIVEHTGRIGGGALPEQTIDSIAIAIAGAAKATETLAYTLRQEPLPIIGVIEKNVFLLDLRTVFPDQDKHIVESFRSAIT